MRLSPVWKYHFPLLFLKRFAIILVSASVAISVSPMVQAFDPDIHINSTENELGSVGFDDDTASVVGNANASTDYREALNSAAHGDNNNLGGASARLETKITEIGDALDACKRSDALIDLGKALHTVQDVYSHSNSIDNARAINILEMANGTETCALPNFAPDGLVSGYFSGLGWLGRNECLGTPGGSCCHRDLNKDNGGVPNGARHPAALAAADSATGNFIDLVENGLRDRFEPNSVTQFLKMLKRKQRTNVFVIDITGSMSEDIAGVQSSVNSLLDELIAGDEAPTLGLYAFKDAGVSFGDFCNIEEFRTKLNSLSASGGGDCPEASNITMLRALNDSFPRPSQIRLKGGRLLLATDASPRSPGLGPTIQSRASAKGVSIDVIDRRLC